ncbi:hypothetical protein PybrP1_004842 [[Pythium] brassicae (nom. inval.)]|nr:hypothetical protein PybrP1_004842 [[Pythium] brassicae (nom. inval.)]
MIGRCLARGVPMPTEGGEHRLTLCGYAEDTALYPGDRSDAAAYLDIPIWVGRAAGVKVNVQKSTGLWQGSHGGGDQISIPILVADATCHCL